MTLGHLTLDRSLWKSLAFALESYLNGEQEVEHLDFFDLPEELIEEITRQRAIIDNNSYYAIDNNYRLVNLDTNEIITNLLKKRN